MGLLSKHSFREAIGDALIRFSKTDLKENLWVPVSLVGKVFDSWIRDLEFNPRLNPSFTPKTD